MPSRDPTHGRRALRFAQATESVTAQAASGDPLEALSPLDRLVFLGKAYRIPIPSMARVLSLSRQTIYHRLAVVTAELEGAVENGTVPGPRPWPCRCGQFRLPGRSYCRRCWSARTQVYKARRRARLAGDPPG